MYVEKKESLIKKYRDALLALDKPSCVRLAIDALDTLAVSVPELYQEVIAPTLKDICDAEMEQSDSVLKEHVRSEITRTVIECCYPYVIKESQAHIGVSDGRTKHIKDKKKVMIVLPSDEHHNLGARMGADFFEIAGFQTVFLGTETPRDVILSGIKCFKPQFVVIHIVNYYNLFKVKDLLNLIARCSPEVRVLASGTAFYDCHVHLNYFGPLCLIRSYRDVESLTQEVL